MLITANWLNFGITSNGIWTSETRRPKRPDPNRDRIRYFSYFLRSEAFLKASIPRLARLRNSLEVVTTASSHSSIVPRPMIAPERVFSCA